jgi:tetratricopeptide (TPR) repeat protein
VFALQDGDLDLAQTHAEEALELILALKDKRDLPGVYWLLADIARLRGDLPQAGSLMESALQVAREMGDQLTTAQCIWGNGRLAHLEGKPYRAMQLIDEAATLYRNLGDDFSAVGCLDIAADVAYATRDFAHAAWCIGAVDRAQADRGVARIDGSPEEHATRVGALMRALGEPGWRKHWGAGYGHDPESVLDVALGWRHEPVTDALPGAEAATRQRDAR